MKGVYPGAAAKGCPPRGSWGMGYIIVNQKRDDSLSACIGEDRVFKSSREAINHMQKRPFSVR